MGSCIELRQRTVKLPAVVTNVASNAGGGDMSPQSRGDDAQMVPPAAAMHMKNIAAATAPGAGHEDRNARQRISNNIYG